MEGTRQQWGRKQGNREEIREDGKGVMRGENNGGKNKTREKETRQYGRK